MSKDTAKDVAKEESPLHIVLMAGTTVTVDGVEVCLSGDTDVDGKQSDYETLREHSTAGPIAEYPKYVGDTLVKGAEEEAALADAPKAKKSNLEGTDVEMDDPAFDAPHKKSAAKKK